MDDRESISNANKRLKVYNLQIINGNERPQWNLHEFNYWNKHMEPLNALQ